jgi:hypothetical protein
MAGVGYASESVSRPMKAKPCEMRDLALRLPMTPLLLLEAGQGE